MEPLGGLDAAFLAIESATAHMHVAAVIVLDPPEGKRSLFSPSTRFGEVRRMVEERIHLVPALRQRPLNVPFGLFHPVLVDDPEFDLQDHLFRASLPSPGRSRELDNLVAEILTRPLDLDHPLWEMVVVDGMDAGRTAIVAKIHHSILDGVSGANLLGAFLDLGPRSRSVPAPDHPWAPPPIPSSVEMLRYGVRSIASQPGALLDTINSGIEAVAALKTGAAERTSPGPHRSVEPIANDSIVVNARLEVRSRVEGTLGHNPRNDPANWRLFGAPKTSINGTISARRRFASLSVPLEHVTLVKRTFATTVNDVFLASVSGALRRMLTINDELPEETLVGFVPVSTRRKKSGNKAFGNKAFGNKSSGNKAFGNEVSGMRIALGTGISDPIERLLFISAESRRGKLAQHSNRGRLIHAMAQSVAPAVASRASKWASTLGVFDRFPPMFNVTLSSVPGPKITLWCAGSRVVALYPAGPIVDGVGLNVTSMTYGGSLHYGLLGCRRLVPNIQDLAILIDDAMEELIDAATARRAAAG
ncbi:MAG: wax ester/triacylglycerol synthase family O-acyltransferase [Actinobacteria bacterium]|nr:wax ester/triacylglycerol synthase family O-acyltransferase [Actinomycetota bacterium]